MQVWFDNLDCQVKQSCHLNENKHPQLSFHIGPCSNALVAYYMNVMESTEFSSFRICDSVNNFQGYFTLCGYNASKDAF